MSRLAVSSEPSRMYGRTNGRTHGHPRGPLRLPLLLVLLTIGLAWAALWAWAASPYGGYLRHESWLAAGPLAGLCRALPGGGVLVPALLTTGGWVVMTAAMMLPTILPLLAMYDRVSAAWADHGRLMGLLVLGYLAVWSAFGMLAHGVHAAAGGLFERVPGLALDAPVFGAAVVAGAGAFQFSALKYRCLQRCRSPFGFVARHWRGHSHMRHAFALGVHHGLFCVGCCWALMLLMFAVGAGSLAWMLALAAVMALEKNVSWGARLRAPLGWILLAWSGLLIMGHVHPVPS